MSTKSDTICEAPKDDMYSSYSECDDEEAELILSWRLAKSKQVKRPQVRGNAYAQGQHHHYSVRDLYQPLLQPT